MAALKLSDEMVSKAVGALLQLQDKIVADKTDLLEKVGGVHLQVSLKKIPPREKQIKLKLPNSLKQDETEVCLFVKDLDKSERDYEPSVRHFQDLLSKHGVTCVSEIIPLKSLKTEYKPYETKRNLSNAYDIFLADARIVRLLPSYLGKFFYGRKKHPVSVNLLSKHLSHEIDSAVGNSTCQISSKGASSLAKVATIKMGQSEITANVLASVTQIVENVAGGAENIKQLFLKTDASTSIPIYLSAGGPQDVAIERDFKWNESPEAEELSTLMGAKVKVFADGRVKVIKDGKAEDEPDKKKKRYSKRKVLLKKKAKAEKFEKKGKKVTKKTATPSTEKSLVKIKNKTSKKTHSSEQAPAKKRKVAS